MPRPRNILGQIKQYGRKKFKIEKIEVKTKKEFHTKVSPGVPNMVKLRSTFFLKKKLNYISLSSDT